MRLPANFIFSQSSLQDYQECRRRFQLRYLMRLSWPAIKAEPALDNEHLMQLGARFHRLAQQYLSGIPAERIAPAGESKALSVWWENFLVFQDQLPAFAKFPLEALSLYPEIVLSTTLGTHQLIAKYDLIAGTPDGRFLIFDWKTSTYQSKRENLANRMQTRIYPYLLASAGQELNGGSRISPEQITMVYWFANFPHTPETFPYHQAGYEKDRIFLEELLAEIGGLLPEQFTLTPEKRRCAYCQYRSLCDRGIEAGTLQEEEIFSADWGEINLDFGMVPEIDLE